MRCPFFASGRQNLRLLTHLSSFGKAWQGRAFFCLLIWSFLWGLLCFGCARHRVPTPANAEIVGSLSLLLARLDPEEAEPPFVLPASPKNEPPPPLDDRYGPGALGPRILLHTDEVNHIAPERLELYRIEPPQDLEDVSAQKHKASFLPPPAEKSARFRLSDAVLNYLSGKPPKLREGRLVRVWEVRSAHAPLASPIQAAQYDALAYLRTLGVESIYDLSPLARKLHIPQRPKADLAIPRIPQTPNDPTAPTAHEWQQMVEEAARLFGLDPTFVAAMIQVESNFDHRAISTAGAQGAMQIMPKTQELLGLKDPFDARANIYAGCAYIRALLNKYQRVDLALAAYNAGPGAVDRAGGIPPYRETQNYVRKVLELWQVGSSAMPVSHAPKDKVRVVTKQKKRQSRRRRGR